MLVRTDPPRIVLAYRIVPIVFSCQSADRMVADPVWRSPSRGTSRTRTGDTLLFKQALFQLSYGTLLTW
jgi:hypothetical protein